MESETKRTPGKGQLLNASPDVHSVFEVGATPMPVNSSSDSSGCSIGMSASSYLSRFVFTKILTSSRSSLTISMLRFVMLNAKAQFFGVHYSKLLLSYGYFPVMGTACPVPDCPYKRDMSVHEVQAKIIYVINFVPAGMISCVHAAQAIRIPEAQLTCS